MPHVDYEAAIHDLARRLRAKPGWGTKELHALIEEVQADNVVSENLLQRALRLYGGSLTITTVPESDATTPGESPQVTAPSKPEAPGPSSAIERSDDEHEYEQDRARAHT